MAWWKTALVASTGLLSTVHGASRDKWISRSIYQIVTDRYARSDNSTTAPCDAAQGNYCGGTFQGIINKLDYVQELGFDAIWISPAQSQVTQRTADLSAYHGYWPNDLYTINSHFGTPSDLKALSSALHARGMYLMLDVVVGDMAWAGNGTTVDYSTLNPFNNQKFFHDFKLLSTDPTNETCVLDCWLGDNNLSLPDLRNEDQQVQQMLGTWVSQLISNYSIDGLRIDSVLNIPPVFFPSFNSSAGVFCLGEGATMNAANICPLQSGLNGLLNYPLYYILTDAFNTTGGDLNTIIQSTEYIKSQCKDVLALGTFTANQDVPRFGAYTSDISLARNILTSGMLADGIPILYYGEEQHLSGGYNPVNREALWPTNYSMNSTSLPSLVQSLNRIRSYASGTGKAFTSGSEPGTDYLSYLTLPIFNSTNILATRKGFIGNQVVSVLSNLGAKPAANATTQITLSSNGTGFQSGQNVTEILSCQTFVTDSSGNLLVDLSSDGGPRVYYPTTSLNESANLCGYQTKLSSSGTSTGSAVKPTSSTGAASTVSGSPWGMRTLLATTGVAALSWSELAYFVH